MPKPNEREESLERAARRAFARLPPLEAPPGLLPNVMAAVREAARRPEARARHRRRWLAWPLAWQVGSVAGGAAGLAAVATWVVPAFDRVAPAIRVAGVLMASMQELLLQSLRFLSDQAVIGTWTLIDVTSVVVVPLAMVMLGATVALGSTLYSVARGGASP
jgi:hypothetical protein